MLLFLCLGREKQAWSMGFLHELPLPNSSDPYRMPNKQNGKQCICKTMDPNNWECPLIQSAVCTKGYKVRATVTMPQKSPV